MKCQACNLSGADPKAEKKVNNAIDTAIKWTVVVVVFGAAIAGAAQVVKRI